MADWLPELVVAGWRSAFSFYIWSDHYLCVHHLISLKWCLVIVIVHVPLLSVKIRLLVLGPMFYYEFWNKFIKYKRERDRQWKVGKSCFEFLKTKQKQKFCYKIISKFNKNFLLDYEIHRNFYWAHFCCLSLDALFWFYINTASSF